MHMAWTNRREVIGMPQAANLNPSSCAALDLSVTAMQGGRQFDVSCCNSGARLVVAATSASLQQAEAAMRNSTGMASPGTSVLNPYRSLVLPVDADAIVRQKVRQWVPIGSLFPHPFRFPAPRLAHLCVALHASRHGPAYILCQSPIPSSPQTT